MTSLSTKAKEITNKLSEKVQELSHDARRTVKNEGQLSKAADKANELATQQKHRASETQSHAKDAKDQINQQTHHTNHTNHTQLDR